MEKIRAIFEKIIGGFALIAGLVSIVSGVFGDSGSIILGIMLMFGGFAILRYRAS
jgi:hypothetical protein